MKMPIALTDTTTTTVASPPLAHAPPRNADTTTTKTLKATATDNCSKMVTTFNYTDSRTNGTCPYNYTINRTWTATDSCGNISLPCSRSSPSWIRSNR
ncbi:MAG: hypothetical protein IPF93_25295 [Saprospiraceae bacterium]|nr:hypothetical protein [Saprospiraceae bacterium]